MHLNFSNCSMRWLPLVGSFKLQVSFAEYRLFYRALLQKRPILLRSLLLHMNVTQLYLGVASISRLLKIIGLLCRVSSLL